MKTKWKEYKFLSSDYNVESGLSKVVIKTSLGNFEGTARRHPDDYHFSSRFFGCELAEMRAYLSYIRALKELFEKEQKSTKKLSLEIETIEKNIQEKIDNQEVLKKTIERAKRIRRLKDEIKKN